MRPLFPWLGGATPAGPMIWERLGVVHSLTVPFAGALGEVCACPDNIWRQISCVTLNDAEPNLANVFRSIWTDADSVVGVIQERFHPLSESDLHASRAEVRRRVADLRKTLEEDIHFCDIELAAIWMAAFSAWIGTYTNFLSSSSRQKPAVSSPGRGVFATSRDLLANARELKERLSLHPAWILCQDWTAAMTDAVIWRSRKSGGGPVGVAGIIVDPPYAGHEDIYPDAYAGIAAEVRQRLRVLGANANVRAVISGFDDEHDDLLKDGWTKLEHTAGSGYSSTGKDPNRNQSRHRVWFSPFCLQSVAEGPLFKRGTPA